MADGKTSPDITATLNQVVDLLTALKSGDLGRLIAGATPQATDCDYHCVCNQSKCSCRGAVAAVSPESVSFPEFLAIRDARLTELKRELEALQVPDNIKK